MHKSHFDTDLFESGIFTISVPIAIGTIQFNAKSIELFHHQYQQNGIYRQFCILFKVEPKQVENHTQIPFMPIRFFKSKEVKTGDWNETVIFTSSGTTGNQTSRHFVRDITLYETSFINGFKHFYGSPTDYVFLALLPSYLERTGSSLVYMVEKLMRLSGQTENGFYLHDTNELYQRLTELEKQNRKVILIGVSFALLDFAERFSLQLKNTIVMETGGMKGKREEMTRVELHSVFQKSFGLNSIHSEYGMTELFSQAYSRGEGRFFCPPWMKVAITAIDDPKEVLPSGKSGRINIIDLANIHSVAFIATDDLGKINEDGSFEILGRLDNSDLRGCNLLID